MTRAKWWCRGELTTTKVVLTLDWCQFLCLFRAFASLRVNRLRRHQQLGNEAVYMDNSGGLIILCDILEQWSEVVSFHCVWAGENVHWGLEIATKLLFDVQGGLTGLSVPSLEPLPPERVVYLYLRVTQNFHILRGRESSFTRVRRYRVHLHGRRCHTLFYFWALTRCIMLYEYCVVSKLTGLQCALREVWYRSLRSLDAVNTIFRGAEGTTVVMTKNGGVYKKRQGLIFSAWNIVAPSTTL